MYAIHMIPDMRGTWSSTVQYKADKLSDEINITPDGNQYVEMTTPVVDYAGQQYYAKVRMPTIGIAPSSNPTQWAKFGSGTGGGGGGNINSINSSVVPDQILQSTDDSVSINTDVNTGITELSIEDSLNTKFNKTGGNISGNASISRSEAGNDVMLTINNDSSASDSDAVIYLTTNSGGGNPFTKYTTFGKADHTIGYNQQSNKFEIARNDHLGANTLLEIDSNKNIKSYGQITVASDPTNPLEVATKDYVDNHISPSSNTATFVDAVMNFADNNFPASTYSNGNQGVGAKIIADSNGFVPSIDDAAYFEGMRLAVINRENLAENGIYILDSYGSANSKWQLTRADDFNSIDDMLSGLTFTVKQGNLFKNGLIVFQEITGQNPQIGTAQLLFSFIPGANEYGQTITSNINYNNLGLPAAPLEVTITESKFNIPSPIPGFLVPSPQQSGSQILLPKLNASKVPLNVGQSFVIVNVSFLYTIDLCYNDGTLIQTLSTLGTPENGVIVTITDVSTDNGTVVAYPYSIGIISQTRGLLSGAAIIYPDDISDNNPSVIADPQKGILKKNSDKTIISNISGNNALPVANNLSDILDKILGNDEGSTIFRESAGWQISTFSSAISSNLTITLNSRRGSIQFNAPNIPAGGVIEIVMNNSYLTKGDDQAITFYPIVGIKANCILQYQGWSANASGKVELTIRNNGTAAQTTPIVIGFQIEN